MPTPALPKNPYLLSPTTFSNGCCPSGALLYLQFFQKYVISMVEAGTEDHVEIIQQIQFLIYSSYYYISVFSEEFY